MTTGRCCISLGVDPRAGGRSNKERIERLYAEGRMGPAGQAAIDAAKENGTWSLLDDVENLVVPEDLGAEFDPYRALTPRTGSRAR